MGQPRKRNKPHNDVRKATTIGISNLGMYAAPYWLRELQPFLNPHIKIIDYDRLPSDLDFIIFDGGADVYPSFYGEIREAHTSSHIKRDSLEMFIFNRYFNTPTKYIGICRGHQLLNVFMRGTLHQDLPSIGKGHNMEHNVVTKHSILQSFVPNKFYVNSLHHQAVKDIGFGLMPSLLEPKTDIVEGLEMNMDLALPLNLQDKIRSVQCHPEMAGFKYADELMKYLFRIS